MKTVQATDLFQLKTIGQPVYVNDMALFLETRLDEEKNTYCHEIVSIHQGTKERQVWGIESGVIGSLKVSPNHKWVSFLAKDAQEKQQIYLMSLTGGRAFALTKEAEGVMTYEWTSTGASLYYETTTPITEEKPKFVQPYSTERLSYQLDGSGLKKVVASYLIKKIDVATKIETLISMNERRKALAYVATDESYLIISDDLDYTNDWVYGTTVYYYDIAQKTQRSLTTDYPKGNFTFVEMAPNGTTCLLAGNDFSYAFVTQTKLYAYDLLTDTLTALTDDFDEEIGDAIISDTQQANQGVMPHWLTDDYVAVPITTNGRIDWYNLELTTKVLTKVSSGVYHFTDAAVINEDTLLVGYSTPTEPSILATLSLKTKVVTPLYNPNTVWLKDITLSQPQEFWYKSVDDWKIQGWYLPPVTSSSKHPAMLYIHGGPQVCYGETFFHEMQVHAANGYGVILLNPRGGQGYGQEFVAAILGDYGNKDYQDLMNGLDTVLAEHPEIDETDVYVIGGSYGGFMTNWIVGHTNRFKAAITQRSISNWVSFYGASDVGAFFVEFQLQRDLSKVDELWRLSPLAYVNKVNTPTLVMHSEDDLRCPLEQGQQFYVGLKKAGVPTKLVMYPESSHGLSRNGLPNLRLSRLAEIENWFTTHR